MGKNAQLNLLGESPVLNTMNAATNLLQRIRACTVCEEALPCGANPIVQFSEQSKIVLVSQAPGSIAHDKNLPYKDASGKTLRRWLGVDEDQFYDPANFAILPVGFCYPGKGKSGDLPPRPECAPLWHEAVWQELKNVQLTLLIGQYAQRYYLQEQARRTLTATVRHYTDYLPDYFPIVHPSPRNGIWLRRNAWFEQDVVPVLQKNIHTQIG